MRVRRISVIQKTIQLFDERDSIHIDEEIAVRECLFDALEGYDTGDDMTDPMYNKLVEDIMKALNEWVT